MSVSDTIGLLSENGSFQWKEADPVGKVKRSDFAPPGEAGADFETLERVRFTERITVLKCHKPNLCV